VNTLKTNKYLDLKDVKNQNGYTILEMLFVCSVIVVVALMGMGSFKAQRMFGIEMNCVSKLKQISQFQENFRDIGDPSLNPDGSFGTFFELQNAGFIAPSYDIADTEAHEGQPFIPFYQIDIVKSPTGMTEEPDANQYMVIASPIGTQHKLRIFMMQEDGEVYFLSDNTSGQKMVWQ
jgi:Tfp pilus assembly protein PilE